MPVQVHPIGSCGKVFAGYLTLKAVERQKLKLDDSVRNYLPANLKSRIPGNITILDLLQHTSELPDYRNTKTNPKYKILKENNKSPFFMRKPSFLSNKRHTTRIRRNYEYSNTNYVWLQEVLKSAYGVKDFPAFVKKHFSGLGLTSVRLGIDTNTDILPGRVIELNEEGNTTQEHNLEKYHDPSLVDKTMDGGFICSTQDLETFLRRLFIDRTLLRKTNLNQYLTPMNESGDLYGFGFIKDAAGNYLHQGLLAGHQALWYVDPKNKRILVYANNISAKMPRGGLAFYQPAFDNWFSKTFIINQ